MEGGQLGEISTNELEIGYECKEPKKDVGWGLDDEEGGMGFETWSYEVKSTKCRLWKKDVGWDLSVDWER
uniref:Uncharacterized protein n=1 Tax=Cucumis melo TaxID=3656 RepID=A0A9I9CTS4_CUCME